MVDSPVPMSGSHTPISNVDSTTTSTHDVNNHNNEHIRSSRPPSRPPPPTSQAYPRERSGSTSTTSGLLASYPTPQLPPPLPAYPPMRPSPEMSPRLPVVRDDDEVLSVHSGRGGHRSRHSSQRPTQDNDDPARHVQPYQREESQPRTRTVSAVEDWFGMGEPQQRTRNPSQNAPPPLQPPPSKLRHIYSEETSRRASYDREMQQRSPSFPSRYGPPEPGFPPPSHAYPLEPSPEPPTPQVELRRPSVERPRQQPQQQHQQTTTQRPDYRPSAHTPYRHPLDLSGPSTRGGPNNPIEFNDAEDDDDIYRNQPPRRAQPITAPSSSKRPRDPNSPSPRRPVSPLPPAPQEPTPSPADNVIISPHNFLERLGAEDDEQSRDAKKRRKLGHHHRHQLEEGVGSGSEALEAAEELERSTLDPNPHGLRSGGRRDAGAYEYDERERERIREIERAQAQEAAAEEVERVMYSPQESRRRSSPPPHAAPASGTSRDRHQASQRQHRAVSPSANDYREHAIPRGRWAIPRQDERPTEPLEVLYGAPPTVPTLSSSSSRHAHAEQQQNWQMYTPNAPHHEREKQSGPWRYVQQPSQQQHQSHHQSREYSRYDQDVHHSRGGGDVRMKVEDVEDVDLRTEDERGRRSSHHYQHAQHHQHHQSHQYPVRPEDIGEYPPHYQQQQPPIPPRPKRVPSLPWSQPPGLAPGAPLNAGEAPTIKLPPLPSLAPHGSPDRYAPSKRKGASHSQQGRREESPSGPRPLPQLSELTNAGEDVSGGSRRGPPRDARESNGNGRVYEEVESRPSSSHYYPQHHQSHHSHHAHHQQQPQTHHSRRRDNGVGDDVGGRGHHDHHRHSTGGSEDFGPAGYPSGDAGPVGYSPTAAAPIGYSPPGSSSGPPPSGQPNSAKMNARGRPRRNPAGWQDHPELSQQHAAPPPQHARQHSSNAPPPTPPALLAIPAPVSVSSPMPPRIPVVKRPVIPPQRQAPPPLADDLGTGGPQGSAVKRTSVVYNPVTGAPMMQNVTYSSERDSAGEPPTERPQLGRENGKSRPVEEEPELQHQGPPPSKVGVLKFLSNQAQTLQWVEDDSYRGGKPRYPPLSGEERRSRVVESSGPREQYEPPTTDIEQPPPPQLHRSSRDRRHLDQPKLLSQQEPRPSSSSGAYYNHATPPSLADATLHPDSGAPPTRQGSQNSFRYSPQPPAAPTWMDMYPADQLYPPKPPTPPLNSSKTVLAHRLAAVEEAQVRVWLQIAREEIPKASRLQQNGIIAKLATHRRVCQTATGSKGALRASRDYDPVRLLRKSDPVRARAAKMLRGLGDYWRQVEREAEKEAVERKKRVEMEMFEKAKKDEENREAARQAKKLEFLLTQTELYSHFVGNKGKGGEDGDDDGEEDGMVLDEGANGAGVDPTQLDFENTDSATLRRLASKKAQKAAARTKKYHAKFQVAAGDGTVNGAVANGAGISGAAGPVVTVEDVEKEVADLVATRMNNSSSKPLVDLDSDELNFQNPSSMNDKLDVAQPKMLQAELKDYQLKGLNWLATLYEQGINGILADEMGLGKTVQSIALLAHLAEAHNIWGPFLIVAPASTLHNWHQELTRFLPALKAIPYWGNPTDRRTLRKYWANNRHAVWTEESECHIIVTSYTLMINDLKYFQAINWQFLVLDEAQAIKNSSSSRWNALLELNTRNRLLLTGTPIQNSMQELWALLHFIMPSLFDSHDEFAEWFSKDLEGGDQSKRQGLNEHQLRRLHLILKPFMLRRVKRMVQTHLQDKVEIDVFCEMSPRQRNLYRAMRSNISVADLLNKATHLGDASSARHLMNLVMQFRKVCNHPELFMRTDVLAPFAFSSFARTGSIMREGAFVICPDSARNPVELSLPKLLYHEGGILSVPGDHNDREGFETHWLQNLMNIWSTDWLERSLKESDSAFAFLPMLHITPSEAHQLHVEPTMRRLLAANLMEQRLVNDGPILCDPDFAANLVAPPLQINPYRINAYTDQAHMLPALSDIGRSFWISSYLSRSHIKCYVAPAEAPPASMYCAERTFIDLQSRIGTSSLDSLALYGLPSTEIDSIESFDRVSTVLPGLPSPRGIFGVSSSDQLPVSPMHFPDAERLIFDSAKLARLDSLLQELKAGGHRALIYFQMVKMIDIMEEYLVFRQYKYLRLDGSSSIEDRRDMVMDWQTRPDIFVFLLSTHAGGLGINLTAADTVIFYENDWNPSNDSQAMDRAHRIGQTKQVTVYRLITKGTIDERIVQLARVKKEVSDVVVGNKDFREIAKPTEIVSLLLDDEELKKLDQQALDATARNGFSSRSTAAVSGWELEGDDFFSQPRQNVEEEELEAEAEAATATPQPKSKRKAGQKSSASTMRGRGRPKKYPSTEP